MIHFIRALCLILLLISQVSSLTLHDHASALREKLFANYSRDVLPVQSLQDSVNVQVDAILKQLVEVDVKTQQMTLLVWYREVWVDTYLSWNPAEYGGISVIRIDPNDMWIPDVIFLNSIKDFEHLREVTMIPPRVDFQGKVRWLMPLIKTTTCVMNVRYFPYDVQNCNLTVGSWSSTGAEVNVSLLTNEYKHDPSVFSPHHQWQFTDSFKVREVEFYDVASLGLATLWIPSLAFGFTFKRKPEFYENNLIIPTAMISCLAVVTFILPNDSGEKVGFSITVFLSLCVNLVVMTDYVPASSETFPIIGEYYLVCIALIAISIFQTAFILTLYYMPGGVKPLPGTMRVVFFEIIGPWVGYKNNPFREQESRKRIKKMRAFWKRAKNQSKAGSKEPESQTDTRVSMDENAYSFDAYVDEDASANGMPGMGKTEEKSASFPFMHGTLLKIESSIVAFLDMTEQKEKNEMIIEEWKFLARVIDRCLALIYLVVTTGCTVVFTLYAKFGSDDSATSH